MIRALLAGCFVLAVLGGGCWSASDDDEPAPEAPLTVPDRTSADPPPGTSPVTSTSGPPVARPVVPAAGPVDAGAVVKDAKVDAKEKVRLEITAPPGGKFELRSEEMGCSLSGDAATFTLRNLSSVELEIVWLDDQCQSQSYGAIAPNDSLLLSTFVMHRWRVQEKGAPAIVGDFMLLEQGSYEVTVR